MNAQIPLSGGDGIPRERSLDFPEDVFLANFKNQGYLKGCEAYPNPIDWEINVFGLWLLVIAVLAWLALGQSAILRRFLLPPNPTKFFFLLAALLIVFVGLIQGTRKSVKRLRLTWRGLLLIGQVKYAESIIEKERYVYVQFVTIRYCVRLPDGRVIEGIHKSRYSEDHTHYKIRPYAFGAPVALLYLSDDDKMLL